MSLHERLSLFFSDLIVLSILIFIIFNLNLFLKKYTYFSFIDNFSKKIRYIYFRNANFLFFSLIIYSVLLKIFFMMFNGFWVLIR
jgi:hypothetical protein